MDFSTQGTCTWWNEQVEASQSFVGCTKRTVTTSKPTQLNPESKIKLISLHSFRPRRIQSNPLASTVDDKHKDGEHDKIGVTTVVRIATQDVLRSRYIHNRNAECKSPTPCSRIPNSSLQRKDMIMITMMLMLTMKMMIMMMMIIIIIMTMVMMMVMMMMMMMIASVVIRYPACDATKPTNN